MAEIEEIPIESADIPENIQNIQEDFQEETPNPENIQKKGRGRPSGSLNKPKPAPKVKAKVKAKVKVKAKPQEYIYEESESDEEPETRYQQPVDKHALASEVLNILQQQRYQRTNAKRNHYASWFENMS